jgi:serine/threonine-protein kinase
VEGASIGDQYSVGSRLGGGSVGEVYQATQRCLQRSVAIKVLRSDLPFLDYGWNVERFHHEALVTAKMQHPNVVRMYDFGRTEDGNLYMVLEHVQGQTLEDWLAADQRTLDQIGHVFCGLLEGLEEVHRQGLVHRDLKPANVMVCEGDSSTPSAKILDFGLAVFGHKTGFGPRGTVVGSLGYMAPEQIRGQSVGVRSDLYAVAVMAYEAITGGHPFDAVTVHDWLCAHTRFPAPELRGIPPALTAWIHKGMAKDPDARFTSAKEMKKALQHGLGKVTKRPEGEWKPFHGVYTSVLTSYATMLFWVMLSGRI